MTRGRDSGPRLLDDVDLLRRLKSRPEIFDRLLEMRGPELARQQRLREEFPDDLVRAALLLAELRARGREKFRRAEAMWFDRAGLEQATGEPVARHKAKRFAARTAPVVDLCCGIGADAIALAADGPVTAVDLRAGACLVTEWNAEVYGVAERVQTQVADAMTCGVESWLVHLDPDRRPGGQRSLRLEDHQPSLEFQQSLTTTAEGGGIKLSPASNFGGKFPGCEIELVSLDGECKEAVVWFGALRSETEWRATVLPAGDSLAGDPWMARADVTPLGGYLYDPDPAVVRAGLVDVLAEQESLRRLDPAEEYLTSDEPSFTPFTQCFEVVADLPNNDREIRAWFRAADCGQVEIKCRRIPISAEKVRRQLSLAGTQPLVLVFARIGGRARAVIGKRLVNNEPAALK